MRTVKRQKVSTSNEGQEKMIDYELSDNTAISDDCKAVDPSTDADRQPNSNYIELHDGDYRSQMEIDIVVKIEELAYSPYRKSLIGGSAGAVANH